MRSRPIADDIILLMGAESSCTLRYRGKKTAGKALLETKELLVRGERRLVVPYSSITAVDAADGILKLTFDGQVAEIDIGADAEKWANKIRNPRSLADKLGVKSGMLVSIVGVHDATLTSLVESRTEHVYTGAPRKESDIIFFAASTRAELERLPALRAKLRPNGAIWVIRPKGKAEITESDVMSIARQAGLVDVKVASYSETHTAEKLVIPVTER